MSILMARSIEAQPIVIMRVGESPFGPGSQYPGQMAGDQ
jgi:hypothetical protein